MYTVAVSGATICDEDPEDILKVVDEVVREMVEAAEMVDVAKLL